MATKKKTGTGDASASTGLPEALDKSFKDNTALSVAYVAGKNFFFDERLAKSQFDQYQTIQNPYAEAAPEGETGEAENE